MKMNKKKALAIANQVLEDAIKLDLNPSVGWQLEGMIEEFQDKPSKFFKTEQATDGFLQILNALQKEGKLGEL